MSLTPGFHFVPTDEELVTYYLQRKATGQELPGFFVIERDVYADEPWNVFGEGDPWVKIETADASGRKKFKSNIYAITALKKMGKARVVRTAGCGTWHGENKAEQVRDGSDRVIGFKKRLVFEAKAAVGNGHWIMQEYSLSTSKAAATHDHDQYVLCKITRDDSKPLKRSRKQDQDDDKLESSRKMMRFDAPLRAGINSMPTATYTTTLPLQPVHSVPVMPSSSHGPSFMFAPPLTSATPMPSPQSTSYDLPLTFPPPAMPSLPHHPPLTTFAPPLWTSAPAPSMPSSPHHPPLTTFAPPLWTSAPAPAMPSSPHHPPLATFAPPLWTSAPAPAIPSSPHHPPLATFAPPLWTSAPAPAMLSRFPPAASAPAMPSSSHDNLASTHHQPLTRAPVTSAPAMPSSSHDLAPSTLEPATSAAATPSSPSHDLRCPAITSSSDSELPPPSYSDARVSSSSNAKGIGDSATPDATQFSDDLFAEDPNWLDKLEFDSNFDFNFDGFDLDIESLLSEL